MHELFSKGTYMTLVEMLSAARQLSKTEKIQLIRFLVEDLDTVENISPLEPFKTYDLPTPYDSFGAGAVLIAAPQSVRCRSSIA